VTAGVRPGRAAVHTYRAGPGGVEVLEFRASTSFDMQTLDQDVAQWQRFAATAAAMREAWKHTRPEDPDR
jgi:hypothetical protein